MTQDFSESMLNRTDEELIKIVTVDRKDYRTEAVEADGYSTELKILNHADLLATVQLNLTSMTQELQKLELLFLT